MRILQLPSWYLPEGGQFCLHQTKALQTEGHEVHILANVTLGWKKYKLKALNPFAYRYSPFFCEENGVRMLRNFYRPWPKSELRNIERWAKKTLSLYEKYRAKYGDPDVIHVHSSMWGGYAAALIKEKYQTPYVITEHRGMFAQSCKTAQRFFKSKYTPYLTKAFSDADHIVPVSQQLIGKITTYLTQVVPITVVSNVVDTQFFCHKQYEPQQNKPFVFVSTNGYRHVKGYDILLPAFDRVCKQNPNVCLRLVGGDFEKRGFLKLLNRCANRTKISFSGELEREGVRNELYAADAYVMPSRIESQSVSVLEALSCGLPVVGTTAVPAEVLTTTCGIRVPVENVKELAKAMLQLIEERSIYNGQEISDLVDKMAHPKIVAQQLTEIYAKVIAKRE